MSVFRAFIAIDLPGEILERLSQVSVLLQEKIGRGPVRWVTVDNIHLTLKFLGDVSVANTPMLQEIIHSAAAGAAPFEFSIGGLGAFPNERRPRVIWVGIEIPPAMLALQHVIDVETARLGYQSENRAFSPHLTLARVSRNADQKDLMKIGEVLNEKKVGFVGAARVDAIHLIKSDLRPDGAVYTLVYSAKLEK